MLPRARVFSLFIAGPSDVADEQAIVRETVDEWNRNHGPSQNAFVTVTAWLTHSHPAAGTEPQAIINRQVLDAADVVVALFWTRFGTPTSTADSGTVEEIERSIAQRKRVMLYFSDRPIHPSELDQAQYEKVVGFRENFRDRGLYSAYDDLEKFRALFRTHLALMMNELRMNEPAPGPTSAAHLEPEAISMTMSTDYWVVVLGALETQTRLSLRTGAELAAKGVKPEDVPDAQRTALAAPILIRAFVIDVLVKHGVMRPEAGELAGTNATLRAVGYTPPEAKK